jgi:hypothetical protein
MGSGAGAPTRLIGVAVNPLWGMLPKTAQKAIFNQGQHSAEGFEGGWPMWAIAEFNQVQPYDTVDSMIDLPDGFTLLSILGISYQVGGEAPNTFDRFAFELYDVNREQWFFEKLVNDGVRAGHGNSPLFEKAPYSFAPQNAQCLVRVAEQLGNTANIQVILFGVVGGQQ